MAKADIWASGAMEIILSQLDAAMMARNVMPETRAQIIDLSKMMYEYIPYAINQGKNPTDGKVLAAFLASKGLRLANLSGDDEIACGVAVVEFLLATNRAVHASRIVFLPVPVLAWGLALIDLIKVGNSCTLAQKAYYEAFLRENAPTLEVTRSSIQAPYCKSGVRLP